MKKKVFLTESDRKKIMTEKEKAIVESFAKNFNKIKRIDEAYDMPFEEEIGDDYEQSSRGVEYGVDPYAERPSLLDNIAKINYATTYGFRGPSNFLYAIYVWNKDNQGSQWNEKYSTVEKFNQAYGTELPKKYSDPDDFVNDIKKIAPEIEVTVSEFDIT